MTEESAGAATSTAMDGDDLNLWKAIHFAVNAMVDLLE